MANLIDDQTASNYYNELDTATGDDLQSKTIALEAWATNKKAVQARQEWDHVSKVFTDFDNYSAAEGLDDFDEESRYQYANRKFIANQTGDTPENQMFIYPSKRDEVTDKLFGKTGLSEKESFDLFKHSVESRTASEEALRELPGVLAQGVLKRADEGKPFDEVDSWFAFSDWKERHADKLASMPKGWETAMLDSAVKLHARTEALMDDVAPESKRAMDVLMKFTRPEDAESLPEADRADVENLAKDFAKLTPEKREGIYATLSYAAEAGGAGMGKGFWEKVGEGMARGGGNIYDDATMTAQDRQARQNISFFQDLIDKPQAEPDTMQTADSIQMQRDMAQKGLEENKQRLGELRVMREIRDLAQGRIDPIKTEMDGVLGSVVQGAYDFSQSAAYTGMAMIPYVGLPAVMGALANSNYLRMLDQYPDMDADAAFDLSLAIAGPQAVVERFQGGLLLGKLPFLGKAMKKLTDARVPLPARIGLGYAGVVGLETGTELIQEAMPVVADQLAAAVREDMPEFDAGKAWGEYREQAPKIFYSMLWGGLMGGGAVGIRELDRSGVYMRNVQELEMHGITGEAAQNIAAEQDQDAATTLYREAWDNRSPEDIQAGIAKRAAMLDAAQATQANPDFPTRRIEENPDGTLTHIIEKGDGSVIYRTTDPVEADMALVNITRMMERSAITGTTRGIVESLSFIDQVNQAAGRGEDVQKLLLNDAPRTLLTDYEANPTEQNLDNLFATVRSQGQDINEPAELANFPVLASNQGTLVEGVFRSIIQIQDGATGDKVIRDFSQDNLKRAIAENRITMDWVRENLNQVIPLIESERNTGPTLRTETDTDVIESFSDVAVAYMTGRIREEQIPEGFRGFLRRMAIIVKDIFRRSYNLKRAIAEGKVDSNFESFLADSVGLNQQARVDTARERVSNEVLTDTNYSIGTNPFPMEQKGKWWANEDFEQRGGRISTMSPDQFLSQVRPLEVDDASRDNIDDLKNMMQSGRKLDPLAIYADGKEDGRHRAIAAKELGMDALPVIDFRANKPEPKGNDFSIGSRTSAVSTDTPSIRASNATITGPANYSIGAFHGTPHKVDKFSTQKIGTGEGAQAYGWGLYFAESRDVAKTYVDVGIGNRTLSEQSAARQIFDYKRMNGDIKEGRDLWIMNQGAENRQTALEIWNRVSRNPEAFRTGNFYSVELDVDDADLLDWDKPIIDQPRSVFRRLRENEFTKALTELFADKTAGEFYTQLSNINGGKQQASQILNEAGIPGIRYLDGGSRSEGQGTFNYVAFDENLIKITEENGNRIAATDALAAPSPGATNYSIGKSTDSVTPIAINFPAPDVPSDIKNLRKYIRQMIADSLQGKSIIVERTGTEVKFTAESRAESVSKARTPIQAAPMLEAEKIVLSGIPVDISEPDPNKKTYEGTRLFRRFAIPVSIGGDVYASHFTIREPNDFEQNKGVFYEFNLGKKMEPRDMGLPPASASRPSKDSSPFNLGSNITIAALINKVKGGASNYSISSQSEIDRVERALGGMNRGPDARLAVYERAKAKLLGLMQSNQASLDDLRKGTVSFRRTQVLQALGELDAILSIFPPDLRGRVGGYTRLASIAPHDVFKDGEKVSEVSGMNGAIISAWMREGQNIGQAGQQTELPPGYTAKENLGTARADRAISDFFKKRIEMIDRELEKTLRREYDEAFRKLLDRTKPKKAAPGEKPKGIGGDIQDLFAVVRDSVDMSATDVMAHIAGLDAKIASGELTAEQEARAQVEAALVALTGDWRNADSDRRRTALTEATRIWSGAYAAHAQKVIRQREEREIARAEAIVATGKVGDMPGRTSKAISDSGLKGTWKDYILNLLNFDQVVGVLFGENSEFSNTIIDKQRLAENAKEDGSQTKMQALEDFFSGLAGGDLLAGERLRYQLTQPSMTVNDIQMSQLEGLSAVMMWAQKDGRRHMEGERDENGRPSGKWNYDQAFVDEITANLSAEALALRDWLSQQYSAEYTNINAVYSELNGVNLPQIQNYSPVTVQPVNAPAGQVLDPVSGSAMSGASTSPGALRTRGTSIAEPRFQDVLQTYIAHTLQMEHWKAFAPMLAEVNGILRNRNVQNSVQEKGGIEAREMLNSWLDYFGQGGTRDAGAHLALNQGLNNVLGRASQVALVGRISTLLIQSTQLGAALAEVPAGPYLKRMGKLLSGQLSWDAALNSDYIQRRIKQMPPVVQMAMQGLKGAKPTAIQQAGKRLGMLLSGADGLFTAGTYAIVYDWHLSKAKELGLAGQQAEDYARNTAERATDRIAQPTRAGARSLYENTQTNPLARAGWAFASEARKNLALVAYSFAERDTATKLRTIAYVLAVNAIGSQILRSIWRDTQDDDDEELFDDKYWNPKRFLMAAATEPLYGIPVFGSMLEEAVYKSAGEYNPQTSLFSVASAVGPIKRLPDHLSGDTEMRDVFSDIDKIISSLGIMHPNIAATASMTHLAKDLFGLADSAVDAATED